MPEVKRFRRKPEIIEAVPWTGSNLAELGEFTGSRFTADDPADPSHDPDVTGRLYDQERSCWAGVRDGQWVARDAGGEFAVFDDDALRGGWDPAETLAADRRMFRYAVPDDHQAHAIPLSGAPMAAALAMTGRGDAVVEFWAESAEGAPQVMRAFRVFGTGDRLPDGARWAATCPRTPQGLVLHLYELPVPEGGGDA